MKKRIFDVVCSVCLLTALSPLMVLLAVIVGAGSRGGVLYLQKRVGKGGKEFWLYKFRTMQPGADKAGLLTVGDEDPRITPAGHFLRRYKLDELPQLFNVLRGDMSMVGPRPEVQRYVSLYNEAQKQVLLSRPGITDYASIHYAEENRILAAYPDPEQAYIREIMPSKLMLNLAYISKQGFFEDLRILGLTFLRILKIR